MNEVITLQVGQYGNRIGALMYDVLGQEHTLESNEEKSVSHTFLEKELPHTFFHEAKSGTFHPRALSVDYDRGSLDELKSSTAGGMYCPSSFVSSGTSHSCQRNWAKGYYTQSSELEEEAMDVVRRLAEDCDSLQGFLMLHSAGGGTGGGLGSRLLTHLGDEYPDRIVATQSLLPSAWRKRPPLSAEAYNCVLSHHYLGAHADLVVVSDNAALRDIHVRYLGRRVPSYHQLNFLIGDMLSLITSPLRWRGQGVERGRLASLRHIARDMVPLKPLKYLLSSVSPIVDPCSQQHKVPLCFSQDRLPAWFWDDASKVLSPRAHLSAYAPSHTQTLPSSSSSSSTVMSTTADSVKSSGPSSSATEQPSSLSFARRCHERTLNGRNYQKSEHLTNLWSSRTALSDVDLRHGRYLNALVVWRGQLRQRDMEALLSVGNRNSSYFAEWIPSNLKTVWRRQPLAPTSSAAGLLSNNTAVMEPLELSIQQSQALRRKKLFLHWFTGEGMEEEEIIQSEAELRDVTEHYESACDATASDYGEDGESADDEYYDDDEYYNY